MADASNTARSGPFRLRDATRMHAPTTGTTTAAAMSQASMSAESTPAVGLPATRKIARPAVRAIAQRPSERFRRRLAHQAPSGRAKSSDEASSGCTSTRDPNARAIACAM